MAEFTAPGLDPQTRTMLDESAARHGIDDPDLGGLDRAEPSDLDDLAAELTATITPTTDIKVTGRPGYAVRCRLDFTGRDLDLLRKRAKDKKFSDGIDGVKFAGLLLGLTCTAIIRNGEPLELDGVSPVTFTSKPLQAVYGTGSAVDTARKFYALDGHLDAAARKLMDEAGWGDEADTADPTE